MSGNAARREPCEVDYAHIGHSELRSGESNAMREFDARTVEHIAAVHATIVQADDPAVRALREHSEALLIAGLRRVYPDLNGDELRDSWQDDGFATIFETAARLRRSRTWLEREPEIPTPTAPGTRTVSTPRWAGKDELSPTMRRALILASKEDPGFGPMWVENRTWKALLRRGLVEYATAKGQGFDGHVATDAGRAALNLEPASQHVEPSS